MKNCYEGMVPYLEEILDVGLESFCAPQTGMQGMHIT